MAVWPLGKSAGATLPTLSNRDNLAGGAPSGSRRVLRAQRTPARHVSALLFAGCALTACTSETLPPVGAIEHALVRLEDRAEASTSPSRVRLLVVNAGLGILEDATELPTGDEIRERIEMLAARAAAFGPDIAVVYNVPLAGKAFRIAGPVNRARPGTEWDTFDAAEHIAVDTDLRYRVEAVTRSGRVGNALGRAAYGPVVLSEAALTMTEPLHVAEMDAPSNDESAATDRWPAQPSRLALAYANGPTLAFPIQVVDHIAPSGDGLRITRGVGCEGGIASDDGALCVYLPEGAEVLRVATDAVVGAAGTAIRLEFTVPSAAADDAPDVAPEASTP